MMKATHNEKNKLSGLAGMKPNTKKAAETENRYVR